MKSDRENKAYYQHTFDEVHASKDLLRKVKAMKENATTQRGIKISRYGYTAAAIVAVLIFSNVITYAASGNLWLLTITMPNGKTVQKTVEAPFAGEDMADTEDGTPVIESAKSTVIEDLSEEAEGITAVLESKGEKTFLVIEGNYRIDITEDFQGGSCKGTYELDESSYYYYEVTGTPQAYDITVDLISVVLK